MPATSRMPRAGAIVLPFLVISGLAAGACTVRIDTEERTAREEKRFAVTGVPEVIVSTFDGSIEVRSWDRDEVLVEVEKRGAGQEDLDSIQVRAEQKGNRIEVEATRPSGRDTFSGIGVHISTTARLVVSVPRKVTLQARSGDGSIRVDRVEGRFDLRTRDGSVKADRVKGTLDIETDDGSITVDEAEGETTLTTADGGITLGGRLSLVKARTGDGSVTVRADEGSAAANDWTISTEDGGVALYLPGAFSAEIDAQTDDGRIRTDFEALQPPSDDRREERRRRTLNAKLGSGGRVIRIRTGDGSISLRKW